MTLLYFLYFYNLNQNQALLFDFFFLNKEKSSPFHSFSLSFPKSGNSFWGEKIIPQEFNAIDHFEFMKN